MCELAASPKKFDGDTVRLTANLIFSDHGAVAYGPTCPAVYLDYDDDPEFRSSADWDKLLAAVFARRVTPEESLGPRKDFRAEVTARFDWRAKKADGEGGDSVLSGTLTIKKMHSFHLVDRAYANAYDAAMDDCDLRATLGRELEIARKACDRAVELRGTRRAHFLAGLVALDEKRFADARGHFDAAYAKDRRDDQTLYGRGIANRRLGREVDALRDMAEARRLSGMAPATDPAGEQYELFDRFETDTRSQ